MNKYLVEFSDNTPSRIFYATSTFSLGLKLSESGIDINSISKVYCLEEIV